MSPDTEPGEEYVPGTQLHVQIASGGTGEPHGKVYATVCPVEFRVVYIVPLAVEGDAARSTPHVLSSPAGRLQILIVLSSLPEASSLPSALIANELTGPTWP